MAIEIVIAKAHAEQLEDAETLREKESIQNAVNNIGFEFTEGTVNYLFVKGIYNHEERRMITACLFVNKMDFAIRELHGSLRMKFKDDRARIAKATLNFDEDFMGILLPGQALLVHIGIPVKGLEESTEIRFSDITGSFDEVRVTKAEE